MLSSSPTLQGSKKILWSECREIILEPRAAPPGSDRTSLRTSVSNKVSVTVSAVSLAVKLNAQTPRGRAALVAWCSISALWTRERPGDTVTGRRGGADASLRFPFVPRGVSSLLGSTDPPGQALLLLLA